MIDRPIDVLGHSGLMTCVSMGNPHAVTFGVPLDILTPDKLAEVGRAIEHDPMFPERTNAHFVEVNAPDEITMLIWERGSGPTQASGTSSSAACVAGALTGRCGRDVTVHMPGGDLHIAWPESDNHVYMTGPAVEIFTGDWPTP
jgi:diaminopimelate epimerase